MPRPPSAFDFGNPAPDPGPRPSLPPPPAEVSVWQRLLGLGARRIPGDPAQDPVAGWLSQALGLDQPLMASRMMDLDRMQQQRFAAGGAGPPAPSSPEAQQGFDIASNFDMTGAIKAYHGSPHTFDAFDMSKIGTGEGAQAYGHGLYFAENPGVAKSYQENLSQHQPMIELSSGEKLGNRNAAYSEGKLADWAADRIFARRDKFGGNVVKSADDFLNEQSVLRQHLLKRPEMADALKRVEEGIAAAQKIKADKNPRFTEAGSMYTANLDVNHEDLLDWDLPLSQQPEKVRKKLEPFAQKAAKQTAYHIARGIRPTLPDDMTGAELYRFVAHTPDESSAALRAAGIPGISYLDAGSRDKGEGSRNIVLFDDALAQILERK